SIIINAWVPILFEYGNSHGDEACKERAVDLLRQITPESNRVVDIWKRAGIVPHDAAQSQALIQLYNEYCQHRFCLRCQLGSCFIRMRENVFDKPSADKQACVSRRENDCCEATNVFDKPSADKQACVSTCLSAGSE
ncbi:MAG: DUF2851 family protein, partial [Bacteroidales bacterium]|nr:DUF2851 family protein [Candidatus Colimorpha onthohippi]